jgi:formylglycine-generating enzyme required for sulfatase activity
LPGMRGKYYCLPPDEVGDFHGLFRFIWKAGVGNDLVNPQGPGQPWTKEFFLEALGDKVSERTLENWHSGAHPPDGVNWRRILDVVSNRETRQAWTKAFLDALAETHRRRKAAKQARQPDAGPPTSSDNDARPVDVWSNRPVPATLPVDGNDRLVTPPPTLLRVLIVAAALLAVTVGAALLHARLTLRSVQTASAGETFRDGFTQAQGQAPQMILLPMGQVVVGSPETEPGRGDDESRRHSVTINYRLAVSVDEVTWDEYELCVNDGACTGYLPPEDDRPDGARPAANVSFNDVYAYLHWLNRKLGIAWERFDRYTLLSEAEWEYAAFAGQQGVSFAPYSSGHRIFTDVANFNGLGLEKDGRPGRHIGHAMPVGSYPANAWGLHDMHGNVWEWVEDCYRDRHQAMPNDGRAWIGDPCSARVTKGGGYGDPAPELRAANRNPRKPETRADDLGFRVARRHGPAWQ